MQSLDPGGVRDRVALELADLARADQPIAIVIVEELLEHLAHVALGPAPGPAPRRPCRCRCSRARRSRGTSSRRAARGWRSKIISMVPRRERQVLPPAHQRRDGPLGARVRGEDRVRAVGGEHVVGADLLVAAAHADHPPAFAHELGWRGSRRGTRRRDAAPRSTSRLSKCLRSSTTAACSGR